MCSNLCRMSLKIRCAYHKIPIIFTFLWMNFYFKFSSKIAQAFINKNFISRSEKKGSIFYSASKAFYGNI